MEWHNFFQIDSVCFRYYNVLSVVAINMNATEHEIKWDMF